MSDDVERLRTLSEAATPGPWEAQASEDQPPNALVYGPDGDSFAYLSWNPGNDYDMPATAAFIVAAVNYVRAALPSPETTPAGVLDEAALTEALPRAINFRFLPPRTVDDPIWAEVAAEIVVALGRSGSGGGRG